MTKPLTDRTKTNISDLYRKNMSIGAIANELNVSIHSVQRHKNYSGEPDFDILRNPEDKMISPTPVEIHVFPDNNAKGSIFGAIGKAVLILGGIITVAVFVFKILEHRYSLTSTKKPISEFVDPFTKNISRLL